MKKLISICVFLFLTLGIFAQSTFIVDGIAYSTTSTNTVAVTSGGAYTGSITIPSSVVYSAVSYTVTSIGIEAFSKCTGLTYIIIPNSVTSIESDAFVFCIGLSAVIIPSSVNSIGIGSFYGCSSLSSITIPGSVTSIGSDAFSVTAWYNSQPDGLIYAGNLAYKYKGVLPANTSITLNEGTTGIVGSAFANCTGLTSIILPSSVTSIGDWAFYNCSGLSAVTLPGSVTSIGDCAFYVCSALSSVTIPGSVTSMGNKVFSGTAWYTSQPDGLVYAGKIAYAYKGIMPNNTSITLNEGTTGIAGYAFDNCIGLTSITLPSSITSIGSSAFSGCSGLSAVTIPGSVTSIGSSAFGFCSGLSAVTIPRSVTSIGILAFSGCSALTILDIAADNANYSSADGVLFNKDKTKIVCYPGKQAVYEIPGSVTSIEGYAFSHCSSLSSITIPSSVTSIGDQAFASCNVLTSITIPSSVTSIGSGAFSDCYDLTSVILPNSINSIGDWTFFDCSDLTSVTIPSSVTSIGMKAFSGCSSLSTITILGSVTSIGNEAFHGTAWYNSQPDGLVYAGKVAYAYKGVMPVLTSITLNEGSTGIAYNAFANYTGYCTGLTSITLPSSVTSIGNGAFQYCSGLSSFIIPSSVTSIGDYAFYGCIGLTSIYANATNPVDLGGQFKVFYDVNKSTCILYVPAGSKADYQTANQWKDFTNIIEMTTAVVQVNKLKMSIYPNPANGFVEIEGLESAANVSVYNLQGQELFTRIIVPNDRISIGSLPRGLYLFKVNSHEGEFETKLIKE